AVIAVYISSEWKALFVSAIYVPARDRTHAPSSRVTVLQYWRNVVVGITWPGPFVRTLRSFENSPAIVSSGFDNIEFLEGILAHVADINFVRGEKERNPPGILEAKGKFCVPAGGGAVKRIVGRR